MSRAPRVASSSSTPAPWWADTVSHSTLSPRLYGRPQDLAHPAVKDCALDGPVNDPRGIESLQAQGREEGLIRPRVVGHVTVQVVETAITPQLALSERGRGAGREPLLPGAPLHPPWGGRLRQGAAVVATSIPPSSGLPPTGSRPHSACHRGPCARAHQDGAPVLPHSWSARPLRPARTALTPRAASKWPGMSRRFWAHRGAGPLPSPTRPHGAGGS
jgi:hypothetical protein